MSTPNFRLTPEAAELVGEALALAVVRSQEKPLGEVVVVRAVFKDMMVVGMLTGGSLRTLTVTPYN